MIIKPLFKENSFHYGSPENDWDGNTILQTKVLSGQVMRVIQKSDNEPNMYELFYLDMMSEPFSGMDNAKSHASEFATAVLDAMKVNIQPT